jgi:hypothetical protein
MARLTYILVVLSFLSGPALAQPQAPIAWGEARWFGIGYHSSGQTLASMGDTLLVSDYARDSTLPNDPRYSIVTVSHDDGMTWIPWHRLNDSAYVTTRVCVAASGGWLYAFVNGGGWYEWVYRSVDGGSEWSQSFLRQGVYSGPGFAAGENVICVFREPITPGVEVRRSFASSNHGGTWDVGHEVTRQHMGISQNEIAMTRTRILLSGVTPTDSIWNYRLYSSYADHDAVTWSTFQELPGQPLGWDNPSTTIAADTSSETAIIASVWYENGGWGQDLFVHRTTDGGNTWEEPQALTEGAPVIREICPEIFCRGKMWGIAWSGARAGDDSTYDLCCRISANHGKDWYAVQKIDTTIHEVSYTGGQFTGNEIRLYWSGIAALAPITLDYATVSGTVTPDTESPILTVVGLPPDTVPSGGVIILESRVIDNDTLSEVRVRFQDDRDSTWVVPMNRSQGHTFAANWTAPREGFYRYRIEAEDFWENVGSYPDTGWASFVTEHWSSADPFILQPHSFSLSAYPNPFNPATSISISLPRETHLTLDVFDVTGRLVRRLADGRFTAGEHTIRLDAGDMASGIYFAHVAAGEHSRTQKMVLMK